MPTHIEYEHSRDKPGVIRVQSDIVNQPRQAELHLSVIAVAKWGDKTHQNSAYIRLDLQELKTLRSVIDSVIKDRE